MPKLIIAVFLFLFVIVACHMDFLTEVQKGNAIDSHGRVLTMQDCTWFNDRF